MSEDKDEWDLYELCKLGDDYRKDHGFEMFGKPTSVVIKPLPDKESIPISTKLQAKFGLDDDDDAIQAAQEEVDEARDEAGEIDMSELDDDFMDIMEDTYEKGVCADETWPDEDNADERKEFVKQKSRDGAVVEIAMEILELSGTLEDALKFPGRGSQ